MGQRTNSGGLLDPEHVIGRDDLVARLWRRLETQSVMITAERRMGKTSIVRDKMGKQTPDGWKLIYLDLSRCTTPLEFVQTLLEHSRPLLGGAKNAKLRFGEFLNRLAGAEIDLGIGLKLPENLATHWKSLLLSLAEDLAAMKSPRLLLVFDELPLMLDAIKRRAKDGLDGEAVVMEILDTLRAIRQENDLRMIYTGSLGLHHVLTVLRDQGYQNDPANDMEVVDLKPLTPANAQSLATRLLAGEGLACPDPDAVAAHLARVTDGIPFYIQKTVSAMAYEEVPATVEGVDKCVAHRLIDLTDPWKLDYFVDRIDTHYPARLKPVAQAILDQLAAKDDQSLTELFEGLDPNSVETNPDEVRKTLSLLGLDHYITTDGETFRFRIGFIQRVWRARRRQS